MNIIDLTKKAFIGGEWVVAYRKKGTIDYETIKLDKGWIADPFLFEYRGEHYLFVEYVKKTKGEIACFKFVQNKPVFQCVVLSEPYHLSYPCVFDYENDIYMIPESADNRSIDLYIATQFPDKWEKVGQLQKGVFYDTTYVKYHGNDYLISYSPQRGFFALDVFAFDIKQKQVKLINEKRYKENLGRPAGRLFIKNDLLCRPAQDCSRKYGEKLFFYQVTEMNHEHYEEKLVSTISVEETNLPYQRIHTYNCDEVYETVDCFRECLQPFRTFGLIRKLAKQHFG